MVIVLCSAEHFDISHEQSLLDDSLPAATNRVDFAAGSAENELLNAAARQPAAFIADASLEQQQTHALYGIGECVCSRRFQGVADRRWPPTQAAARRDGGQRRRHEQRHAQRNARCACSM